MSIALGSLRARARSRTYQPGDILFSQGERSGSVVVLLQGRVKLANVTDGRDVLLEIVGPGDVVPELSALKRRPHAATAVAVTDIEALVAAASAFIAFLKETPDAAVLVVQQLALRLIESHRRRVEFATEDTLGRLGILLAELAERYGAPAGGGVRIDIPLSQEELAGCIGASHKAVTTALQTLRELQAIETARRSITVKDFQRLRERCRSLQNEGRQDVFV